MTNPPILPPAVEKEFDEKYVEATDSKTGGGRFVLPTGIKSFFAKVIAEEVEKAKRENKFTLYALALMWNQYCGKDGHKFMSAGEEASDVLMKAGLLDDKYSEIDYDTIDNILN